MSKINVELHTSSELKIGERHIAEIKNVKYLDSEKKSVCIVNQGGRRARVLGYLNNIPQYTNILADQVVEAMESCNVEKIEVIVEEKKLQKVDDRSIYLLSINNYDVSTYLLGKNMVNVNLDDLLDSVCIEGEFPEEPSSAGNVETLNADNATSIVGAAIEQFKALKAKEASSEENIEEESVEDNGYDLRTVSLKVSGSAKENPAKTTVAKLLRDGITPDLSLVKDENGILRVLLNGQYAGEAVVESNPQEDIDVDSIHSIKVSSFKTVVYTLEVELRMPTKKAVETKVEETEKPVDKNEELFLNIMKLAAERINDNEGEVALTIDDLKSNQTIINSALNIVGVINGSTAQQLEQEVCVSEEPQEVAKSNVVDINKAKKKTTIEVAEVEEEQKAKKVTKEEAKEIAIYLANNDVPQKYIEKILKSYKEYAPRHLERIPSMNDKGFTLWKYTGRGDNLLKSAIICIERGKNLRLVGGKGAGKNTLLSTLAWIYQRPLFSQSANRDTDITHLFGDKTMDVVSVDGQVAQTVEFEKGLLVEAMEVGGFYELGEGNACRPEVTMAIHSVLDSRREADVNGYKLVKADEGFVFALTMNVDYEGCNSLNQAFRDRFVTIPFPSPLTIIPTLKQACPTARNRDIELCDKLYSHILYRVHELQTDEIVTIRGYINALDLAEDMSLKTALQMCVAYNVSDDELITQEILEAIDSIIA